MYILTIMVSNYVYKIIFGVIIMIIKIVCI